MLDLSDDEAAILALIHANRIAVWTQNFEAYQKCFVHAPYTSRWNASPVSGIHVRQGWDEIANKVRQMFTLYQGHSSLANAYDTEVLDLRIRVNGDMAWATFRQQYPATIAPAGTSPTMAWHHAGPSPSHEVRVFERHEGQWRIAFLGYLDPDTLRHTSAALRLAQDGTIEWQSEAARVVLADEDDLVIRGGRLRVRDAKTDARLQAAIKWAASLSAPLVPSRGSLPIVMQAGEGIPAKIWWVIAESGQIHILLGTPNQNEQRIDAAAIVYGLSPSQTEVAKAIVAGSTLAQIARAMGISTNTARTHLDRVFDKTGVRTQSTLVGVLLSAAAPS